MTENERDKAAVAAAAMPTNWPIPAVLRVAGQVSHLAQSEACAALPNIIVNDYLVGHCGFDPGRVHDWTDNQDALPAIAEHALEPARLPFIVQAITDSLRNSGA